MQNNCVLRVLLKVMFCLVMVPKMVCINRTCLFAFVPHFFQFSLNMGSSSSSSRIERECNAFAIGCNSTSQLLGLKRSGKKPMPLTQIKHDCNIIDIKCGKNFTIFIDENNNYYAVGDNSDGQCAVGYYIDIISIN